MPLQVVPGRARSVLALAAGVVGQRLPSPPNSRTEVVLDVGLAQQLLENGQDAFVVFGRALGIAAAPLEGGLGLGLLLLHLAVLLRDVRFVAHDDDWHAQATRFDDLEGGEERGKLCSLGKAFKIFFEALQREN